MPSNAARRVREFVSRRSQFLVVPALASLGLVLGLTFTREPAHESHIAGTAAPPASVGVESTSHARSPEIARSDIGTDTQPQTPVSARRPEVDADPADTPTPSTAFPTYDDSAIELATEHELPAETSGAVEANARAVTLRALSESASPESFFVLEQTLRTDSIARNRLLAVNSLRLLGKQSGNADRAREALHVALSDKDENVATSARDAYEELSR